MLYPYKTDLYGYDIWQLIHRIKTELVLPVVYYTGNEPSQDIQETPPRLEHPAFIGLGLIYASLPDGCRMPTRRDTTTPALLSLAHTW